MKLRSEVFRNFLYIGLGDGISRILSVAAFIYLARVLGPAKLGLIGYGASAVALVFPLLDYGLGFVGTREVSRDPGQLRRYVSAILFDRLLLAAIALVLLLVASLLLVQDNDKLHIMGLYALTVLPAVFSLSWAYQAVKKTGWFVVEKAVQTGLYLAGVVAIVLRPDQYSAVPVIAFSSSLLSVAIVMIWFLRSRVERLDRIDFGLSKHLLRSSFKLFVSTAFTQLNFALALLLIVHFESLDAGGFFAATSKIAVFLVAVPNLLWSSFYPSLSRPARSAASFHRLVHLLFKYALLIGLIPLFLGAAFSGEIVELLYGQDYQHAALPLALFSVFAAIQFLSIVATRILPAFGMEKAFSRIVVGGSVLQIVLSIPLIVFYGVVGAAISFIVAEALIALLGARAVRRAVPLHLGTPALQAVGLMMLSLGLGALVHFLLQISPLPVFACIVVFYVMLLFLTAIVTKEDFAIDENFAGVPQ